MIKLLTLFKKHSIQLNDELNTKLDLNNMNLIYSNISNDKEANYYLNIRFTVKGGTDLKSHVIEYKREYEVCLNDQKILFAIK